MIYSSTKRKKKEKKIFFFLLLLFIHPNEECYHELIYQACRMLRGFRFVRRKDLGKFEDSALSSLLLPVRGFLLPLLHLLLLRLVCEQERKNE